MKIIIDVNPVISALIRDSSVRRIIVNSNFEFCFPEHALQKIRKYKDYIIEKSGLSELEEHIDQEDVDFIATALSQEDSFIWSDDAHFDKQNTVKILKTRDMINIYRDEK